ncbi:hypothetical protein D3C76_1248730 [compost metagenome]
MDMRTFGARPEEGRVRAGELVADMHHQVAGLARPGDDPGGLVGSGLCALQGPEATGEVIVLDVDDDDGLLAHDVHLGLWEWRRGA